MLIVAFGMAQAFGVASAMAGDWYQWRGPEQSGVSREHSLPEQWSPEGENVLWTAKAGGMTSPIVMKGKVYTLSRIGEVAQSDTLQSGPKTQETVVCLDAVTGKVIWQYAMNMTQTEVPFHRLGWSNPVGDPATNRVYVLGAQCNLVCFDGNDGKVLWLRQMTEEFGMISTFGGRTPSPGVDGEQVFIGGVAFGWGDNARAQYRLFAFDKNNGDLNWTSGTGGLPVDSPYQTPMFATIDGQRQVITGSGDGSVCGFQARTGKKLWSYQASKRGINASVLVDGTRVYICHGEVNFTNSENGSVMCIDVAGGKAKEVWRKDGIEAGFASPTLFGSRLYVCDNTAAVFCFDANTGQQYWKVKGGRIGKASLVYGDGKLYLGEANGKMSIIKLDDKKPTIISKVELLAPPQNLGREYTIFGSVAVANGRIYLQTADMMFCIGAKEPKVVQDPLPDLSKEESGAGPVAQLQVVPADLLLRPGGKKQFKVRAFDTLGRPVAQAPPVEWSIGKLTLPPPPAPAGAPTTAPAAPQQIGNLQGTVSADGTFTAANGPHQGGAVVATAGNLSGMTRIRVLPPLPWKFDFESAPLEAPPLTWLGAGGKFWVKELEGNRVLDKIPQVDLYYRARTNFGAIDMANYTLAADVRVGQKVMGGEREMPDPGVINSRYVMMLYGNHQRLQLHVWAGALPTQFSGAGALNKTIPFTWEPDKWYRMKLRVEQAGGKAIARGKVWPTGEPEPAAWTIELTDDMPNPTGNPGLFGHSLVTPYKSDIYYDNIEVTDNK